MVYLSGRQSVDGPQFGAYGNDDVDALRAIAEEPGVVDILLTYPCHAFFCPILEQIYKVAF